MSLAIFISTIAGLGIGVGGGYIWRETSIRHQLRQILAAIETDRESEDISLPVLSKLRRQANLVRQQHQRLEQQSTNWQSVLRSAPIGYLMVDADNQLVWSNHIARELLQIDRSDTGQVRLMLELVRSYELDRAIQKVRTQQAPRQLIWQFYFGYQAATDPESMWLKANILPQADGAVGVFIESQQPQMEAAAARERWLTDLAHEIRTPLTAIRLVAETLQAKVSPDLTRWVDRMLHETNRTIDLVQHFLELSQLETAPAQHLRLATVNLGEAIDEAWQTVELLANQRQIELVRHYPHDLDLKIDRDKFVRVFINLFDNSIKYCPIGGRIWLEVRVVNRPSLGDTVTIDLYDDGDGFDSKDLPYVFDRLYRGDLSRNRPRSSGIQAPATTGSGLGLAIVRQIIRAHKGTIAAKNHPQTDGAWIEICLPLTT